MDGHVVHAALTHRFESGGFSHGSMRWRETNQIDLLIREPLFTTFRAELLQFWLLH